MAPVSVTRTSVTFTSGTRTITVTDLGLPPGYVSARALAINNLGQVVGMATDSSFGLHRVIWDGGTFIELPNLRCVQHRHSRGDQRRSRGCRHRTGHS